MGLHDDREESNLPSMLLTGMKAAPNSVHLSANWIHVDGGLSAGNSWATAAKRVLESGRLRGEGSCCDLAETWFKINMSQSEDFSLEELRGFLGVPDASVRDHKRNRKVVLWVVGKGCLRFGAVLVDALEKLGPKAGGVLIHILQSDQDTSPALSKRWQTLLTSKGAIVRCQTVKDGDEEKCLAAAIQGGNVDWYGKVRDAQSGRQMEGFSLTGCSHRDGMNVEEELVAVSFTSRRKAARLGFALAPHPDIHFCALDTNIEAQNAITRWIEIMEREKVVMVLWLPRSRRMAVAYTRQFPDSCPRLCLRMFQCAQHLSMLGLLSVASFQNCDSFQFRATSEFPALKNIKPDFFHKLNSAHIDPPKLDGLLTFFQPTKGCDDRSEREHLSNILAALARNDAGANLFSSSAVEAKSKKRCLQNHNDASTTPQHVQKAAKLVH